MKTIFFITLLIFSSLAVVSQNVYYVATSGSDSNDGLSTSSPWKTITYAASSSSPVSPGDTVYVKAGDYGNENVAFKTNGTASKQITFEGYQSTPGDNPNLEWEYGDNLNSNIMPLLDGGDRTTGTAMALFNKAYIVVKNFQIRNYQIGLYAWKSNHLKISNVIAMNFGDIHAVYDGRGIVSQKSNFNTIENSAVLNAGAEGMSIGGENSHVKNCKVYADDNTTGHKSAMDYYIHIDGNNHVVEDCYVERVGDLDHVGHGIDLKTNCENNLIINCISKGMNGSGYSLRHRGVKNNTIENCTAINCGFTIRDGASYNTIRNCTAINSRNSVNFMDTSEDGGAQYAGSHNVFENCIFQNPSEAQISFFYYDQVSPADNNTFVNCVFDGGEYLFNCDRENNGNKMINSIVTNVQNYYRTKHQQTISYPLNFNFEYSYFYNNGFDAPEGVNITTNNPSFVDVANNDYHLTASSTCIDAGITKGAPKADFDGTTRPMGKGVDIGAFEYQTLNSNPYENDQLLVFPNPATNQITIKKNELTVTEIRLFNLLGQDITDATQIRIEDETSIVVDIKNLSVGAYLLKTKNSTTIIYKK